MMKRTLLSLLLVGLASLLSAQTGQRRLITRSTRYGAGVVNLYDTYPAPLEYRGVQTRVLRESTRMTPEMEGRIARQSLFQGYLAMADNPAETASELAGMVNWNYALHYNFSLLDGRLTLGAGPMWQLHGGFLYNTRNGNNPAQAKFYTNVAASGIAQYDIPWKRFPIHLRNQLDVPLLGVMFSPQFGQSYYEIFSLGHTDGILHFTSLHNQPTLRHWLTADMKFHKFTLRLGYMADMQQSRVGGLRTHDYSHSFMVGLVKTLLPVR